MYTGSVDYCDENQGIPYAKSPVLSAGMANADLQVLFVQDTIRQRAFKNAT